MVETHISQHRLVQVSIFISQNGQRPFDRMEKKIRVFYVSGQQAELGAGEVGGAGDEEADEGDEIPRLLLDISPLASKW